MPEQSQTRRRQEVWEEEYRKHPHLAGKPLPHLVERFCYLTQAMLTLTEGGQLGFELEPRLAIWHLRWRKALSQRRKQDAVRLLHWLPKSDGIPN